MQHHDEEFDLLTFNDMPYVEQLKWALRYADQQLQQERALRQQESERHKQYRLERHIDKVQLYKLWEQQEGKKLLRLKEIITRLNQEKAELEAAKQKVEDELLALQLHVITTDPNN